MRRRVAAFALLCLFLAAIAALVLETPPASPADAPASPALRTVSGPEALARIRSGPHLAFRNTAPGAGYGRVGVVSLASPEERFLTELACDRVHATEDRGICLTSDRGVVTTYGARVFDASFAPGPGIALTGPPSRARVSPDGRFAAFTVFESGHSYASAEFSTRTTIVDARTATTLGHLEEWSVTRDGVLFRERDFNFWGVTFAPDGERFYATLATGGRLFLVEGKIGDRSLRVLREGVECPSLSPDGRRLVYKSRRTENGRLVWGLRVHDLATGADEALDGETRSVDDQVAWLDEGHVLYGLPETRMPPTGGTDVWAMEARPGAQPWRLLEQASSPAVVRP